MFIEQPPWFFRAIYPDAIFRMDPDEKAVYLTFDDGPIPEVTPWVLELLDKHNIKATFFMVGDNIRKHPDVFRMVVERGHRIGNHTFNHIRVKLSGQHGQGQRDDENGSVPSTPRTYALDAIYDVEASL